MIFIWLALTILGAVLYRMGGAQGYNTKWRDCGEKIESQDFSDVAQAIKYLQSNKGPYVIKPECNTDDKGKTFVGRKEDNSDFLKYY